MPARRRGRPPHPDRLTPAEWSVLHFVRHGMSNRSIARHRGISLDAVKFHLGNIRDKLGADSRTELRTYRGQPAGVTIGRGTTMTVETSPRLGHIAQVSIAVKDIEQSVAFYRDVLGIPHLFTAGQLAFFDCAGTRLMIDAMEEAQGRGNSVLYFTVGDINAAQDQLTGKGVAFDGAPHLIFTHPDGLQEWMTFFRDPDGNILSLKSDVRP